MRFIADFHVHSKYSRATAKNLDLENLYIAACRKGISVVGTGDFTHPAWFSEIKEKLEPAEEGLFRLREDIVRCCNEVIPESCRRTVRFLLVSEISNIYKKKNTTRKNHNLLFVPTVEIAARLNSKLDKIGNITSDGRPILGLDARDLLYILLETSEQNYLIPAHIWTPWFSLLGSMSGFDSLEECFEDLSPRVFAVETGLSSDPQMNWRVSGLDGLTLISNSDAHSPMNIGREANLFDTDLSYSSIKSAMKTGDPKAFIGTFEFYPEEGKYHLDGHRKCHVRMWPNETKKCGGKCPVCGKPLTLGVLYRVEALADRSSGERPVKTFPFYSMVPLLEILSEIFRIGSGSKKVLAAYRMLTEKIGPEFDILYKFDRKVIEKAGIPLLDEAIERIRRKEIHIHPGYDGEYGKIEIFNEKEREVLARQPSLFAVAPSPFPGNNEKETKERTSGENEKQTPDTSRNDPRERPDRTGRTESERKNINPSSPSPPVIQALSDDQRRIVEHPDGPIIIIAGPGTGKTRTITSRIAYLIAEKGVPAENILALTFTNKAAKEMEERIRKLLKKTEGLPFVATFHSFCLKILKDQSSTCEYPGIIDDEERKLIIMEAVRHVRKKDSLFSLSFGDAARAIATAKQQLLSPSNDLSSVFNGKQVDCFSEIYRFYQERLASQELIDFEDCIMKAVDILRENADDCRSLRKKYRFVFVDEYQDLNQSQYAIVRELVPPDDYAANICVIGDPNQSIYGFRGSNIKYFERFAVDYPHAVVFSLTRNYRSTKTIVEASCQVIAGAAARGMCSQIEGEGKINIIESATEKSEAVAVGKIIENLIGGIGFHSRDFDRIDDSCDRDARGFSDFAVLYRTAQQSRIFSKVFEKYGIPFHLASKSRFFEGPGISELLSLLKLIHGSPGFVDLAKVIRMNGGYKTGRNTLEALNRWGYTNGFTVHALIHNAMRFPVPGIRPDLQRRIVEFFKDLKKIERETEKFSVAQKLSFLLEHPNFSGSFDPITQEVREKIFDLAENAGAGANDFFSQVSLQSDTDLVDQKCDRVSLLTMHAAKGLEFPVVFIVGCEDGLVPFKPPDADSQDKQEERRLFYVAMTRAKKILYMTYSKKRKIRGRQEKRSLSPFVKDIEERLRNHILSYGIKKTKKERLPPCMQLPLFG